MKEVHCKEITVDTNCKTDRLINNRSDQQTEKKNVLRIYIVCLYVEMTLYLARCESESC